MTIQLPLTLPAYTPTSWELTLPDYPVIASGFRSAFYPEILGSLPSDSRWKLVFENMTDDEALALLLPWRATGGGQWPLTALPEALAYGIDNADFRKRLTGTTWTIEREPTQEPVKKGRYNVTIDLIYELTLASLYGPRNPLLDVGGNPVLMNLSNILQVVTFNGAPITFSPSPPRRRSAGLTLSLDLATIDGLSVVGFPVSVDKTIRRNAASALILNLPGSLFAIAEAAVEFLLHPLAEKAADSVGSLYMESGVEVAGVSPMLMRPSSEPGPTWTTGTANIDYSNNNATITATATGEKTILSLSSRSSGKWYAELDASLLASGGINSAQDTWWGVAANNSAFPGQSGSGGIGLTGTRSPWQDVGATITSSTLGYGLGSSRILMIAIDFDAKKLWFGADGTWLAGGSPAAGANPSGSAWSGSPVWFVAFRPYFSGDAATLTAGQIYRPSGFSIWSGL